MFAFLEFRIIAISIVLLMSFFTASLSQVIYAQNGLQIPGAYSSDPLWSTISRTDPNCRVDIRGDSPVMYPGNFTRLNAVVNGVDVEAYAWAIEPDIIKDYDDRVFDEEFRLLSTVDPVTPMTPSDFQKSSISFYWEPEVDTNRTVGIRVLTEDGICQDVENYTVAIGNTSDTQAEDFYVTSKAPDHQSGPTTRVLQEHNGWHNYYRVGSSNYNEKGDLFFLFHKLYLAHFDAFRMEFGYKPIEAWDPGLPVPNGTDVDHSPRNESGYRALALPPWFEPHPSGNGTTERPSNGMPCERADAPSSSWPDPQDSLQDFEPDKELLGCALTTPYHNGRHTAVGGEPGDISDPLRAPKDPLFWRFHKFIDNVSVDYDILASAEPIGNMSTSEIQKDSLALVVPVANEPLSSEGLLALVGLHDVQPANNVSESADIDTSAPQILYKNPQDIIPFVTEIPKLSEEQAESAGLGNIAQKSSVTVTFNEPVRTVVADDLRVNGSAATSVNGRGPGPYIFTGFEEPAIGTVNVNLLPGNIVDLSGNLFAGESWNYTLSKPTSDNDMDGVTDGLEINQYLTDPTNPDTDQDTMPDGFELKTTCLNPLVDDRHVMNIAGEIINKTGRDADNDGVTDIREFNEGTSPCSP